MKVVFVVASMALALSVAAASAKERKAAVAPRTYEVKRSLFSGSESHFQNLYGLYSNCTASATEVRIVKPPSKGEIRFEEAPMVVAYAKNAVSRLCVGKTIANTRLYYKSTSTSPGTDTFTIDVDSKIGAVQRIKYIVEIR